MTTSPPCQRAYSRISRPWRFCALLYEAFAATICVSVWAPPTLQDYNHGGISRFSDTSCIGFGVSFTGEVLVFAESEGFGRAALKSQWLKSWMLHSRKAAASLWIFVPGYTHRDSGCTTILYPLTRVPFFTVLAPATLRRGSNRRHLEGNSLE